MNAIRFIQEYMKQPNTIGAIMPSSKQLARQMIAAIRFQETACIVEYGPGTGVFTDELIMNKCPKTKLMLIEQNQCFYESLKQKYGHLPNVHILHGSAEHVNGYLQQHGIPKADYIVSGLPFTSLPAMVSHHILKETADVLGQHGVFITFQYTKVMQKMFQSFFNQMQTKKVYWNIPPAFVYICSNNMHETNEERRR